MKQVEIIDKEISEGLEHLSLKQKKAVLGVVRAFAEEDAFDKEMNRRIADYESGRVKGFSLEESVQRAIKAYKPHKK